MEKPVEKKKVGYINLYRDKYLGNLCHWTGSLFDTEAEAEKYKDTQQIENFKKEYFIGEVYIKEK
ncbi:hypothetical protein LCGC14_1365360 [marine sediment metagenome]|uniref:Uncharacterized protein n=1 Tax=marine sediment metagenome TaxID=412755 RepID=A0A0F9KT08_9ZZZZ